jgi:uncharacterized membrane protein
VGISIPLMHLNVHLSDFSNEILYSPVLQQITVTKYRKIGVWILTLSTFINILWLIPILYVEGYISYLSNLLPGKEQFEDSLSLATAFGLGAIISGVIGNAAYDLLKFIIRKMIERKG